MKKFLNLFILILGFVFSVNSSFSAQPIEETKKQIIALYNSNQLEEAYNMISKLTESERDYEIWYLLGNISQDFNNDTNASFFLQKAIILNPEFDKAHYNLANIYLKEKKYNSAIKEYKLAIKYKKDFPYYYYNLGCAYLGQKEYKEAVSAFKKAIKLKSDVADFYYNLAYAYKNLNNEKEYQKAIDTYNKLKEN
ncbi:MAG: tetratricopeptide repeat protein [Candidatus Gastranaerophilales bacterium]|nr:tetratricopeptide repeat protein [Candidatus Gastranaerophilales bacterium]